MTRHLSLNMRRAPILLLFLVHLSCAPARPPVSMPAGTPDLALPALAATGTAERVVLMTFDGLGADALARQPRLPAFEQLAREGAAGRVVPVNPTVTTSTHVSILTGADPQRHGVVANWFHETGRPQGDAASGRSAEIDLETLVEAARRQGKRVGAVPFPSIDARSPRRSADFSLVWPRPLAAGRVIRLARADFRRDWLPPTWRGPSPRRTSFSPVMRSRIDWGVPGTVRADVDLVAYDRTDDRTENYDLLVVEVDGEERIPDARGWVAVSKATSAGLFGSWAKFLEASPKLDVEIYWGAINRNEADPPSFRALLDAEAGFWPGSPDEDADIDPHTFAEQIERLARFLTRVQTLTVERMDFDLLLAYQPQIDQAAHNFLGYDDGVVAAAFGAADDAVRQVAARLDMSRDALVVTGDHGLVMVEREVRVNRLLADHGLAPRWRAFTSGGVAHLYRFEEPDDTESVAALLEQGGWFERVDRRARGWHRNSGDLIAWARPGTSLSASSQAPAVAEPGSYGHHGFLNHHREVHTTLLAAGRGIAPGAFRESSQTKLLRFVCDLLGIAAPVTAE